LGRAIIELQDHERKLHPTRLPGKVVADADGWIEEQANLGKTPDSIRFGYISDICVMSGYRVSEWPPATDGDRGAAISRGYQSHPYQCACSEYIGAQELRTGRFHALRNSAREGRQ
jgi:hypothetical protein